MGNRIRKYLSYSNVAATIALALAIGGGTAVALQGKNSVRTDDIRNGHVTGKDLTEIRVVRTTFTLQDSTTVGTFASDFRVLKCPKGTRVVGGGGQISPADGAPGAIVRTEPNGNGWQITATLDSSQPAPVRVTALCLSRKPGPPRLDD